MSLVKNVSALYVFSIYEAYFVLVNLALVSVNSLYMSVIWLPF